MFTRVYLKEGAQELQCSIRYLRKWCKDHGVAILNDNGCRKYYVLQSEFELAKSKSAINYLTNKHGRKNLPDVMRAYMNLSADLNASIENNKRKSGTAQSEYIPTGQYERRFLSRLASSNKPTL